jgi:predicted GTPase
MSTANKSKRHFRTLVIAVGLLLPTLTLIPLGSVWLWQHGYLLHWALLSAGLIALTYAWINRTLKNRSPAAQEPAASSTDDFDAPPEPFWTPIEVLAWSDVEAIVSTVDIKRLTSQDAFIDLGAETIRTVAKRLHPEVTDPLWRFTVPEAFAIIEQVSQRLGRFTTDNIPLSDRLTVSQAMAIYEWRGALSVAERAYDAWRIVRMANPLTAATHEIRERLSKQIIDFGRAHVTQRLAEAYIHEVGRAAIDLYSGRLRISQKQIETEISSAASNDSNEIEGRTKEPLRILIAGQTGSGKSSLVNALANEVHAEIDAIPSTSCFAAYDLRRSEFPTAHIIDSPGLINPQTDIPSLIAEARKSDLIIWVLAAHRADREIDRHSLALIHKSIANLSTRHPPPLLYVLSHIDRLRPLQEWAPPYDLRNNDRPKAASIRAALEAVAIDLSIEQSSIVPLSLIPNATYNVDVLWAQIVTVLPLAKRARLARQFDDARGRWNWRKVLSQATGAGRTLGRVLTR